MRSLKNAYCLLAAAAWFGEPLGQEYTLQHGDPVLYWVADETPPTYGQCVYLWGYYPVIYGPRGMREFCCVEWVRGEL